MKVQDTNKSDSRAMTTIQNAAANAGNMHHMDENATAYSDPRSREPELLPDLGARGLS